MATLQIQLFGSFHLSYDDVLDVDIRQTRVQAMLAYLLLHRQAPQTRQQLAFLFWPDSSEAQAHNNLRKLLFQLRSFLPEADSFLQVTDYAVQWRADSPYVADIVEFEHWCDVATHTNGATESPAFQASLEAAAARYAGDLLPGCYDDWIAVERERLRERYLDVLTRLIDHLEQVHDLAGAIGYANRLLRTDPLHEETYRRLMRLHSLNGDRAVALRTYHTCATILLHDLGVEPSPRTQEAYARLLRPEAQPEQPLPPTQRSSSAHDVLIGRQAEWQTLLAAWQHANQGEAQCAVIVGEAGIGKTRLADELLRWANHQGVRNAHARAYAGEGSLAYAPVSAWLRTESLHATWSQLEPVWLNEIARLLPDQVTAHQLAQTAEPVNERVQRQHLFAGLSYAVLAAEPLLLVLDDLQWCDEETLAWLHYLLRFDYSERLLVVATMRLDEVDPEHPLNSLLLDLGAEAKLITINLGALSSEETTTLANQVAQRPLTEAALQRLYATTEGNPLFIVEIVRAMLADSLAGEEAIRMAPPPARIRAIVQQRLARLTPAARDLANLAAIIGRSFTLPVLSRAAGVDEDSLVRGLDELWRRRIVREQGVDEYDFSHDLIREAAELAISTAHRRLLHRRVAEALEAIYAHDLAAYSLQIASHYEQAGLLEPALAYYVQAAEMARYIFAAQEAIGHYKRALTLLKTLPNTRERTEQQVDILLALGATWSSNRSCVAAEAKLAYDEAFALCLQAEMSPRLFTALWGLHEFHLYRSEYERSLETAEQCLRIAENLQDRALLLEAHHAMWGALMYHNRYAAAVEHVRRGISIYDYAHHHRLTFQYGLHDPAHCGLSIASIALWTSGYPDQAWQYLQHAIQLAEQLQIPVSLADAYFNHAQIYQMLRDPVSVRTWAEATIRLAKNVEYPFCDAVGSVLLGWAKVALGEHETGMSLLLDGVAAWKAEGIRNMQTYMQVMMVEAYQTVGATELALAAVSDGQAFAAEFDEHFFEPELYRLQGELLQTCDGPISSIEQCYQQALTLARLQKAHSLELRAATCFARFCVAHNKLDEAKQHLLSVFGWFSEGFETPDLKAAQAILSALPL